MKNLYFTNLFKYSLNCIFLFFYILFTFFKRIKIPILINYANNFEKNETTFKCTIYKYKKKQTHCLRIRIYEEIHRSEG